MVAVADGRVVPEHTKVLNTGQITLMIKDHLVPVGQRYL